MKKAVYLDYAAATPVDPLAAEAMAGCLCREGTFGNPHSKDHAYGWDAAAVVEDARADIAEAVGCSPLEITFTSGATESDNLAIVGLARALRRRGDARCRIITSTVEHKAVLEPCALLEREGVKVTWLTPDPDGAVSLKSLEEAFAEDVFLVSLMHANSELGTVSDINALAQWCRDRGAYFHTDAAQSAALGLRLSQSAVSMASLTAAKSYGPKGIGALYISRGQDVPIEPLICGGGQEKGLRGGTVPTHQAAGMGTAFRILRDKAASDLTHQEELRELLCSRLAAIGGVRFNGSLTQRLPGIVSVTFEGIDGAGLLPALRDTACSSGSACASKTLEPSYVLTGIGLSREKARASLRLSFGRFTTADEIERAASDIAAAVRRLRGNAATS